MVSYSCTKIWKNYTIKSWKFNDRQMKNNPSNRSTHVLRVCVKNAAHSNHSKSINLVSAVPSSYSKITAMPTCTFATFSNSPRRSAPKRCSFPSLPVIWQANYFKNWPPLKQRRSILNDYDTDFTHIWEIISVYSSVDCFAASAQLIPVSASNVAIDWIRRFTCVLLIL